MTEKKKLKDYNSEIKELSSLEEKKNKNNSRNNDWI